jgi:hypothetical protein
MLPGGRVFIQGGNFYNEPLGLIRCGDEFSCWHEVGHLVDDDMEWISKTPEFGKATLTYVVYKIKYEELDDISRSILATQGIFIYSSSYKAFGWEAGSSPQQEVYANIYANVKGDISKLPEILRPFYDTGKNYKKLFNHLMENKSKIILLKGGITYNVLRSIQTFSYDYRPFCYALKY